MPCPAISLTLSPRSLGPNIRFSRGGLTDPWGAWLRQDGSKVYCWRYWQSTLQFLGPDLTVNSYPAHCTVYTEIIRGSRTRVSIGDTQILPTRDGKNHVCLGSSASVKIGVQRIWIA